MRLAFCGASGTGKTTLASYVAGRYGLEMNPVGARSVAAAMGFATPYDVDAAGRRGEFQRRLVGDKRAWELGAESFVTDRTTADNLAYMALHDVASVDEEVLASAIDGLARYTHVVFCPVDAFLDMAGDPARKTSRAYHVLFEMIAEAFLLRHRPATLTLWDASLDARRRKIDALF